MRKNRIAIQTVLLILLSVCVSGCDFFRSLAGRPTSSEIAEKKILIEMENHIRQAREDSIAIAKLRAAEAVAYVDSISASGVNVIPVGRLTSRLSSELGFRYYIVIGMFSSPENAENLRQKAENGGYEAGTLSYRNGKTAVVLSPLTGGF